MAADPALPLARRRVGASLVLLLSAKVATVAVPLVLKRIIDAFPEGRLPAHLPAYLLVGYALLRFSSTLFNEWRDLIFARVTQSTVAGYAEQVFAHLHALGPRFHARRQVGSLLPDIDRGSSGIAYLLGVGLFTIVPTLVEIGLVLAVMLGRYAPGFALVIGVTLLLYTGFTLAFTARRVLWQRRVNKLDARAKGQLADSLINYQTFKMFTGEAFESTRFAAIMARWREAAVANQRALFRLHVGQSAIETALFNDSVGHNIAYARAGATRAQAEAAARAAQLHDAIAALPEGYDTPAGERGAMFSGGERQRIGIARAILKDALILVFDEATSALDADAEHAIVRELGRLARGRTTLIVAHRLSTIVDADAIAVMERGRIVEQDRHAALLAAGGLYAHLWRLQQRERDGAAP